MNSCRLAACLAAFVVPFLPFTARAAGVVGTGSVESCTEPALLAALETGGSVTFDCGAATTIVLGSTIVVTEDTAIDGGGLVTLSGGNTVKVMAIEGADVTIENLIIANGEATGTMSPQYHGAGITQSGGSLTVRDSTFSGNDATANPNGSGGAIYSSFGTLDISGTTFSDNHAANFGGAVFVTHTTTIAGSTFDGNSAPTAGAIRISSGTVTIDESTLSGNSATIFGGAIYNSDLLVVTDSTFAGNEAAFGGGGLHNAAVAVITNSTFSDNIVLELDITTGGALYNDATMTVTNSTIVGGAAGAGGNLANFPGGSMTVTNTIVAAAAVGGNCTGAIVNGGHNLDDGDTCGFGAVSGSKSNTDPRLDPAGLADNAGPTETIALCTAAGTPAGCAAASPAIDAGDQSVCADADGTAPVNNLDQRGLVRPGSGASSCSIGSFEADAGSPVTCGDGVQSEGEDCDDGDAAWEAGEHCNAECAALACGDPNDSGTVTAGDALHVLRTAVGSSSCDLKVCDVSGDENINTTDALRVLRRSVDPQITFDCPSVTG